MDSQILNLIRKPARYIGSEVNIIRKDWNSVKLKSALCFPETYELGMSNLGIRILYEVINAHQDYLAERVFAPERDLEKMLRENGTFLTSLESGRPLFEFDLLGVTLAGELSCSNFLTVLSLGGIPLRSIERSREHPIILARGTGAFTPEPMADFCDAFFVGEGEEAVLDILDVLSENKGRSRAERLLALSKLPGIYVPAFYKPQYNAYGVYQGLEVQREGVPEKVKRVVVTNFEGAPFPKRWLVPYLPIVHDRIGIEIMRGCVHRCQFCQARIIYNPCRLRSPQKILTLIKESLSATGYEEVSLLSLSSGDYPNLEELQKIFEPYCRLKTVKVSFPSLRADTLVLSAARVEKGKKQPALTFAPESSERLRLLLGKEMRDKDLISQAQQAREAGWTRLKLYFMLGLPGETEDDLREIVSLIKELSRILFLNLSFNTFIPKPHTPLERCGMASGEDIREKKMFLQKSFGNRRYISPRFRSYGQSFLECLLARGDRRMSSVILGAWKKGARFDGWDEHSYFDLWEEALKESGINTEKMTGVLPENSVLPWSHIVV
ncbi:MAG: TIGR03960 family B12-binding radical SAM protein [Candidatus Omnitrophota bacterium]